MTETDGAGRDRDETPARRALAALITAGVLGIGLIVLQRWVAATFTAALVLVVVWFVVVALAAVAVGRSRPGLRTPVLATVTAVAVASAGIGYWTGFRKTEVNEDVAMAAMRIPDGDREVALAGMAGDSDTPAVPAEEKPQEEGPVELTAGGLDGADGHVARGRATVIGQRNGKRVLTLTDLDADPGPDVNVYLSASSDGIDDAVDLGDLKAPVGNQQYDIPENVDLNRYGSVVLYCIPFTTRIATAELR